MSRPAGRTLPLAFVILVAALFLPAFFFPDEDLFRTVLTASALNLLASITKLACLATGAAFGLKIVKSTEHGNPARWAWLLLAVWFALFFAGQLVLSAYELGTGSAPPWSAADAFFFAGYAFMIAALTRFVLAYLASGYPVGRPGEILGIAGASGLVFAIAAVRLLWPVAISDAPVINRVVDVGYPVLDLVSLVPTLVLLRMTLRFRGGGVWTVWLSLLLGLMGSVLGDTLFAYDALERLLDPLYMVSYFFLARGVLLQYRLIGK
jgi:hypothetical protein